MKHRVINPEDPIDRVLTGLREAEPVEGMQQRVLRRAKETAGARRRWSLQLPGATTHLWAVAALAVVAIAIAASWALMRGQPALREAAHAPVNLPQPDTPVAQTRLASIHVTPSQPAHELRSVTAAKPAVPIEPVSDQDALAISEMLAPSKPAPPLPLTHQEKLLTEVVNDRAPEELNSLRPDVRDRQMEIAKTEFHDFFEPPSLDTPPAKANE